MSARTLHVAGAHTEIGKTHVACGLLRVAAQEGFSVDALKPIVSDFEPDDWAASDPGRLLSALGRSHTDGNLERIAPWRFAAPLAPPMAARKEGRTLPFEPVLDFCNARIATSDADLMLVEGAGGLMSPIADGATSLTLIEAIPGEVVLVGGGYLGAVSHLLTALDVLRTRGREPAALVVSEASDPDAPAFFDTLELVERHAGQVPVVPASRAGGDGWAGLVLKLLRH